MTGYHATTPKKLDRYNITGKAKGGRAYDEEFKVPVFLTANNLKPFIPNELSENSSPVLFKHKGTQYIGYRAELLPQVCGVLWMQMKREYFAHGQQRRFDLVNQTLFGFSN